MARIDNWQAELKTVVTRFIADYDDLQALLREYVALDYGSALPDSLQINGEPGKQKILDALSSLNTLEAWLNEGHRTNLLRLKE